jgi:hypothetical protein
MLADMDKGSHASALREQGIFSGFRELPGQKISRQSGMIRSFVDSADVIVDQLFQSISQWQEIWQFAVFMITP